MHNLTDRYIVNNFPEFDPIYGDFFKYFGHCNCVKCNNCKKVSELVKEIDIMIKKIRTRIEKKSVRYE